MYGWIDRWIHRNQSESLKLSVDDYKYLYNSKKNKILKTFFGLKILQIHIFDSYTNGKDDQIESEIQTISMTKRKKGVSITKFKKNTERKMGNKVLESNFVF